MAKTQSSMLRGKLPGPIQSPSSKNWYLQPWKKYGDFTGRAPRAEFWGFFFFNIVVLLLLYALESQSGYQLRWIYALAIILPSAAVCVRRLHDGNWSGYFALAPLGVQLAAWPIVLLCKRVEGASQLGFVFFITAYACIIASDACLLMLTVLLATKGDPGSNRFGPPPT
jgi:uncharacterized membrane protein YhaH (DUF805 family)